MVKCYDTGENGAKTSSISHSNGPILEGKLREFHAEILRVGRPAEKRRKEGEQRKATHAGPCN